eukprot:4385096-Amphidinium_carterae.1
MAPRSPQLGTNNEEMYACLLPIIIQILWNRTFSPSFSHGFGSTTKEHSLGKLTIRVLLAWASAFSCIVSSCLHDPNCCYTKSCELQDLVDKAVNANHCCLQQEAAGKHCDARNPNSSHKTTSERQNVAVVVLMLWRGSSLFE